MVPLHTPIVVKGLWQHAQWDPTSFCNTQILTNDAQELIPYKTDANRIKIFCLQRGLNTVANSATPPL